MGFGAAVSTVLLILALRGMALAQELGGDDGLPVPPPPEGEESEAPSPPGPSESPPRAPQRSKKDLAASERLVELIADTSGDIELSEILDEVFADVVAELAGVPLRSVSPLAIRQVFVGRNLRPSFARVLEHRITALIHAGTRIEVRKCIECSATQARVEGDDLVVRRGVVTQAQLRDVAARLGVAAFLDLRFGFDPEAATLEIDIQIFRAKTAQILFAETYRADETTPMLMRATDAPQKREARIEDLRALLEGRPLFGYAATAGVMLIPYDDPVDGDIFGATAGFRLFERFGTDRRVLFGLDLMGFVNFELLSGAILSAGAWWIPFPPDLVNPELRVGGKAGALIVGTEGNTPVFQLGAEVLLRYRFGLYAYATGVLNAAYAGPNGNDQAQLGGLGVSAGLSFNW